MLKLEITGNQNPIVGVTEFYSVLQSKNSVLPQNQTVKNQNNNLFDNEIKWFIYVLDRGIWRLAKGNEKIGAKVDFTFTEKSLKRKEMKMIVHAYGQKAIIDIKPQKASQAKILLVDLLDNNLKTPTKPFAYGEWIIARVSCVDMEMSPLTVTLWEDDGDKIKQNTGNVKIEVKKGHVLNGIADVAFYLDPSHAWLANAKLAKGDIDEGKFHEYYVTAEIFEKVSKRVPSKNANVPNPDYPPEEPKQPIPAEQKGPSKKDEKGIAKSENKVHDYHEQKVVVEPIVRLDLGMEVINSMMMVDTGDDKWWEKKENCVCKEYDLVWGGHQNINCDFKRKVIEISKRQNFDPNHLLAVMWVETNKTFSTSLIKLMPNGKFRPDGTPKKENRGLNEIEIKNLSEDFSGPVGLIQFTPVAIDELNNYYGYSLTKRKLSLMNQLQQLDYVEKYIEFWVNANKIKSKLTLADLYLLIFSPSKMNGSNDSTTLYKEGTTYYNANKSIDTDKKNGITKKELAHRAYESFEEGSKKENKSSTYTCGISDGKKIADAPSSGVLEEMKTIADSHRVYLQETDKNRTADTEAGLAKMDCSEFVSRYLHKLGITKNIIYMTTANMTNETNFRKVIENNNIDLIEGSKTSSFKPQSGDIFAWGRSKDGSWSGHTGVVYEYDEAKDTVTIMEAIGASGAVGERKQVKNGGYSGTKCTRTAIYDRLGGALYGHDGWFGYYRPKNYTKKL